MDKRHVYDWDTRVHLLARGPRIPKGVQMPYAATFVDLAPTFLDIANVPAPEQMDGKSILPLLQGDTQAGQTWRTEVYLEYYFVDENDKCVRNCTASKEGNYPASDEYCVDLHAHTDGHTGCWGPPSCVAECYPTESPANNWRAVRQVVVSGSSTVEAGSALDGEDAISRLERALASPSADVLYAEFATGNQGASDVSFDSVDFHELYEMESDPWHRHNVYAHLSNATRQRLGARVRLWFECAGRKCP